MDLPVQVGILRPAFHARDIDKKQNVVVVSGSTFARSIFTSAGNTTMADYDSDSSGADDVETNVLLGYASKEPTSDEFSQLGGRPV